MRKNVYIDPHCLVTSLLPSAVEEYHKEVSGYLIGSNGAAARRLKVISAYPMQSDIKMPTWVSHGNTSAVKRVDTVMKTMRMRLVGGFHTHPDGPNKLSRSDREFIEEKMEKHDLEAWFELILAVKKKEYLTPQEPGWALRPYANKLGMTVRASPWLGFDLTLSGFWVRPSHGITEATLWTRKRVSF